MWCELCKYFGMLNGVVCTKCIGVVVFGKGVLLPSLMSLLVASILNFLECVHIRERERESVAIVIILWLV